MSSSKKGFAKGRVQQMIWAMATDLAFESADIRLDNQKAERKYSSNFPRQKPAKFNMNEVMKMLSEGGASS